MNKIILLNEIEKAYEFKEELGSLIDSYDSIIILGNGGSSSIASHITQDYTKKMNKRSFTFSDASRLTCYSNDYGYENAYKQFLKEFVVVGKTLVILISSSGNSSNILNCADWCEDNSVDTVTLTGFDKNNLLKTKLMNNRRLNYWVDSDDYGIVECAHMIYLHMVVE
jgi:D-sedoheptulose 7-phosphate isomerase